jgi:hypothetical protein
MHNQRTDLTTVPRNLATTAGFSSVRFAAAIAVILVINLRMFTGYKVIQTTWNNLDSSVISR